MLNRPFSPNLYSSSICVALIRSLFHRHRQIHSNEGHNDCSDHFKFLIRIDSYTSSCLLTSESFTVIEILILTDPVNVSVRLERETRPVLVVAAAFVVVFGWFLL